MANQRFLINNLNNRINTLQTEINDLEEGGMINPSDVDLTFLPKTGGGNAGIIFADNTTQVTAATFPVYTGSAPISVTGTAIGINATGYLTTSQAGNLTMNIATPPTSVGQLLSSAGVSNGAMAWVPTPTVNGQVLTGQTNGALAWANNTDGWVGTATSGLNMATYAITDASMSNPFVTDPTVNGQVLTGNTDGTLAWATNTDGWVGTATTPLNMATYAITDASMSNPFVTDPTVNGQVLTGNTDGTLAWATNTDGWVGTATTDLNMSGKDIVTSVNDLYIYNNSAKDIHLYTNDDNLATTGYSAVSLYAPAASGISNTVQLETHTGTAGGSIDNILALDSAGNLILSGTGTNTITANAIRANSLLSSDTTNGLILSTVAEGSDNIEIAASGMSLNHLAVTKSSISLLDNKVEIATGNAIPPTSFNFFGDANSNVNIQFCDGTIQTTAYTGTSGSWDGNATTNLNMNANDITSSADSFYIYNNAKQPVYLYNNDDNYATTGYGAVSILANNTAQLESHSGTSAVDSVLALDVTGTLTLSGTGANAITASNLNIDQIAGNASSNNFIQFNENDFLIKHDTPSAPESTSYIQFFDDVLKIGVGVDAGAEPIIFFKSGNNTGIGFSDGTTQITAASWVGTATSGLNMATYAITDASMSNPFVTDPTVNGQVLTGNTNGTLAWTTPSAGTTYTATFPIAIDGNNDIYFNQQTQMDTVTLVGGTGTLQQVGTPAYVVLSYQYIGGTPGFLTWVQVGQDVIINSTSPADTSTVNCIYQI
jgi:hypothetical protein